MKANWRNGIKRRNWEAERAKALHKHGEKAKELAGEAEQPGRGHVPC